MHKENLLNDSPTVNWSLTADPATPPATWIEANDTGEIELLPSMLTITDGELNVTSIGGDKSVREKTIHLESAMKESIAAGNLTEVDPPLRHYFTEGVYAREMTIPKNTVIVGKIHKHAHLNFITRGKVAVVTEFGQMVITAPHTMISQPGTKRVVYALEETVWTTIHVTNETDLEKVEDYVIAKSFDELQTALLEDHIKRINEQTSAAWRGVLELGFVKQNGGEK